jgi:hypothetical protein
MLASLYIILEKKNQVDDIDQKNQDSIPGKKKSFSFGVVA